MSTLAKPPQKGLHNHTFHLARAITAYSNIASICSVLKLEKDITGKSKEFLNGHVNRAKAGIRDFEAVLGPEAVAIIRSEIADEDAALQILHVEDLFLVMDKAHRESAEKHVIEIHRQYKLAVAGEVVAEPVSA